MRRASLLVATTLTLTTASLLADGSGAVDHDATLGLQEAQGLTEQMPDAEQLLDLMVRAQRSTDYDGTLVYLHDKRMSALRLSQRVENGQISESLLALSGPVRALARNGEQVACMLPDSGSFTLPTSQGASSLLQSGPFAGGSISAHYQIQWLGESRVAGRDTHVVGLIPRDQYRYGYRFFIDADADLALKIELVDHAGDPIEQMMFTDIDILKRHPESSIPGPAPLTSPDQLAEEAGKKASDDGGWHLSRLPPGFRIIAERIRGEQGHMHHLVVSDGIGSASIYIEPATQRGLEGVTRMGAILAFGKRVGLYRATVIGEIPEQTARMLLEGLDAPLSASR